MMHAATTAQRRTRTHAEPRVSATASSRLRRSDHGASTLTVRDQRRLARPQHAVRRAGIRFIAPIVLWIAGVVLALGTSWPGGELVDRLRVGVGDGARLDAPSWLAGRPAGERA